MHKATFISSVWRNPATHMSRIKYGKRKISYGSSLSRITMFSISSSPPSNLLILDAAHCKQFIMPQQWRDIKSFSSFSLDL
jgi:hypothetical protein